MNKDFESSKNFRLAYMGTPDFAAVALEMLAEAGYDIAFAVTMPDRPKGRGKKLSPTPVKVMAQARGIPVLQPEGKEEFPQITEELKKAKVDLVIVAAYGRIFPKEMLDIPPFGFINIHASLLPRHRGASPIQSAILAGDEETGVSLMYMTEEMDAGDVIATASTHTEEKTTGDLFEELAQLGGELLLETLPDIFSGKVERIPQDNNKATYSSKIKKEESAIDFAKTAEEITRLIRAMNPSPGARTKLGDKILIITDAGVLESPNPAVQGKNSKKVKAGPGTITEVDDSGIRVATGDGELVIRKLKPAGKQSMEVGQYIKGNKIEIGDILG